MENIQIQKKKYSEILSQYVGMYGLLNSYFTTITLPPKLYKYSSITQYELTFHEINKILSQTTEHYLIMTELTSLGNIHYHCIVKCTDKPRLILLINTLKKKRGLIGYSHFKAIDGGHENVIKYLIKDVENTTKILHTCNYKPVLMQTDNTYFIMLNS